MPDRVPLTFPAPRLGPEGTKEPKHTRTHDTEREGRHDFLSFVASWPLKAEILTSIPLLCVEFHLLPLVVTLNASKTPCLDALAFCVVLRLGAHQTPEDEQEGSITITNFQKLLGGIHLFCPKKSQTANEEARIKALKRWFDGIPTKRKRDTVFIMRIKDRKNPVVMQIIKKLQTFCITHGFVRALNPATQQALRPGA